MQKIVIAVNFAENPKEIGQKIEFLHKEREEQERMEKLRE